MSAREAGVVGTLVDAVRQAPCRCSPHERNVGHLTGCWKLGVFWALDDVLTVHAQAPALLDIAQRVEALLSSQRWLPDGDAPEAVLLRDARAAIAAATGATP